MYVLKKKIKRLFGNENLRQLEGSVKVWLLMYYVIG